MEELLQQIRSLYPTVKIWAFESSDRVELQQIEVPPSERGSGIGTQIMGMLKDYARSVGKPIVLRPEPERGKKAALERFYKRLGFVDNSGRNKDYTLSAPFSKTMYWRFKEWLMAEGVENEIDSRFKVMFSQRKRNWRKLMGVEPIPRLVRLYELLGQYDKAERDYWSVLGMRNFVMSVIVGCLVQQLYGEEVGIFNRYDLLSMAQQIPLVKDLEEAVAVARQIYDPNNGIRIGMSSLWTTDLMRKISESVGGIGIRYIHNDGRGLMNNSSLNYDKLDDDEYSDVEDEYLGLKQPPSSLHNQEVVFVFTPEGEQRHRRLIELLTKASKRGVRREEVDLSGYTVIWDSGDGQLGLVRR